MKDANEKRKEWKQKKGKENRCRKQGKEKE